MLWDTPSKRGLGEPLGEAALAQAQSLLGQLGALDPAGRPKI